MKKFEYQEIDTVGLSTLEVINDADKFNEWMYQVIRPHCHGKILEVGSGTGNISHFFLRDGYSIMLSDIRTAYCHILEEKFASKNNLLSVESMDLTDQDFDRKFKPFFDTFDTVFALNVVEHIEDDGGVVKNCRKLLKQGGKLVILVPAYQALYNTLDENLQHYRRYNSGSLQQLFTANSLKVVHHQYFNAAGIFAWFISGKLQNRSISEGQMKLYNTMVPVLKLFDKLLFCKAGLSVIVAGQK